MFEGTSSPAYLSFKDKQPHEASLPTQIPVLRGMFCGTLSDILRSITGMLFQTGQRIAMPVN